MSDKERVELSKSEQAFCLELHSMLDAYVTGTHGNPRAVSRWFRAVADKLDPDKPDEMFAEELDPDFSFVPASDPAPDRVRELVEALHAAVNRFHSLDGWLVSIAAEGRDELRQALAHYEATEEER